MISGRGTGGGCFLGGTTHITHDRVKLASYLARVSWSSRIIFAAAVAIPVVINNVSEIERPVLGENR